jgi:hypothetical protein
MYLRLQAAKALLLLLTQCMDNHIQILHVEEYNDKNNTDSANISNNSFEKNFEIVKNFDKTTQSYIQ